MCVYARSIGLFVAPRTVACRVLLLVDFPRKEYWKGLPFSTSGDISDQKIELASLALAGGFFTTQPPGKPQRVNKLDEN